MDSSSYWDHGSGEHYYYYQTPYPNSYGITPFNSNFDSVNHGSFQYNPTWCYSPVTTLSSFPYSASAIAEHHVVYEHPISYSVRYSSAEGGKIDNFVTDFNETDYEEYDPTPYGGGYDISATYGKALPPSEEICYPRSSSSGSVESSYKQEEKLENPNFETKPENPIFETKPVNPSFETKPTQIDKDVDENGEEQREKLGFEEFGDTSSGSEEPCDTSSGSEELGDKNLGFEELGDERLGFEEPGDERLGFENGLARDYGYGEKAVGESYVPSGYGLEATDLCETIFGGYFPCLTRNKRLHSRNHHLHQEASYCERSEFGLWEETSDYLFGNSNPYGDGRGYGEQAVYGYYPYQRHFQEQTLYQFAED